MKFPFGARPLFQVRTNHLDGQHDDIHQKYCLMGEITGFPGKPSGILHVGPTKSLTFSRRPKGCHDVYKLNHPLWPVNYAAAISIVLFGDRLRPLQETDDLFGSLSQNELQVPSVYFCCKTGVMGFTPWKINGWNSRMEVWKIIFLFNWVIFRFHINF